MKRAITLFCLVAVLVMAPAAFRLSKARAATPAPAQTIPLADPTDVHLFCNETGTPLADEVNIMDVSPTNAFTTLAGSTGIEINQIKHNAGGGPAVVTQTINYEGASNPTSCAVVDDILKDDGLTLQQAFSHFSGFYVEIWSKSPDTFPR